MLVVSMAKVVDACIKIVARSRMGGLQGGVCVTILCATRVVKDEGIGCVEEARRYGSDIMLREDRICLYVCKFVRKEIAFHDVLTYNLLRFLFIEVYGKCSQRTCTLEEMAYETSSKYKKQIYQWQTNQHRTLSM